MATPDYLEVGICRAKRAEDGGPVPRREKCRPSLDISLGFCVETHREVWLECAGLGQEIVQAPHKDPAGPNDLRGMLEEADQGLQVPMLARSFAPPLSKYAVQSVQLLATG